ncbi:PRC-barrel domain-containing protein [Dactylosporangium vinaceum]|uniref:PRC-barrel domain-containing protein n=1 Tax=Dactylosporangium vinaceum TaxID=53362 RepID=A0ABV5MED4_9ACTN|nr:PRC-barrel domain-containing protein [Dactylosporangium vinaceum]
MSILIGFDLLERQIVDLAGEAVGKVDDVEVTLGEDGTPRITALLVGPQALGRRPSAAGSVGASAGGSPPSPADCARPSTRTPCASRGTSSPSVTIPSKRAMPSRSPHAANCSPNRLEAWLREHLITRIPGAHHAGN